MKSRSKPQYVKNWTSIVDPSTSTLIDYYRSADFEMLQTTFENVTKEELTLAGYRFESNSLTIPKLANSRSALLRRNARDSDKIHFIHAAILLFLHQTARKTLAECTFDDIKSLFIDLKINFASSGNTNERTFLNLLKHLYQYVTPYFNLEEEQIFSLNKIISSSPVDSKDSPQKDHHQKSQQSNINIPIKESKILSPFFLTQNFENQQSKVNAKKLKRKLPSQEKSIDKKIAISEEKTFQKEHDAFDENVINKKIVGLYNKSNLFTLAPSQTDDSSIYKDSYFITYYFRTTTLKQFIENFKEDKNSNDVFCFNINNISLMNLAASFVSLIKMDDNKLIKRSFIEAAIMVLLKESGKENLEKFIFSDLLKYFSEQIQSIQKQSIPLFVSLFKNIVKYIIPLCTQLNEKEKNQIADLLLKIDPKKIESTTSSLLSQVSRFNGSCLSYSSQQVSSQELDVDTSFSSFF